VPAPAWRGRASSVTDVPLEGFERRVERMVEGVFSRAFRSQLKPIELGRRLVKEMDGGRSLDVRGRAIVPNAFTFSIAPSDLAAFADIRGPLIRELIEAAKEHARQEGYGFLGPIAVDFVEGTNQRPGRFELAAQMRERASAGVVPSPAPQSGPAQARQSELTDQPPDLPAHTYVANADDHTELGISAATSAAAGVVWQDSTSVDHTTATTGTRRVALVSSDGRLDLARVSSIGRMPDCDLVINDANVSRRHFEVQREPDGEWVLIDLGSTNGTRVNGNLVSRHRLADGDVITIGASRIAVEVR